MKPTLLLARVALYHHNRIFVRHSSSQPPYARPAPPPLPSQQQKEWADLIRQRQAPASSSPSSSPSSSSSSSSHTEKEAQLQLHPDARRPIQPDFEGDTNPATGEVGGPKKEPLKWGAGGEWTYGGRATDF